MTRFGVHVTAHFVVDADSPEQALEWLNSDRTLPCRSYGHQQLVVELDECQHKALRGHDVQAFDAAHGSLPLGGRWSPAAWPARTCAPRVTVARP